MDDFDEEDDTIFGEDDVFDCMVLDELEKNKALIRVLTKGVVVLVH
jgi:hypothetical protein